MKYAYYPGCSLHSTGSEFDISLKAIAPKLDIELEEVPGRVCCGSTPAHSVSELLALALPVANLCQVEKMAGYEVIVPCASCFRRLKSGHQTLESPKVMEKVHQVVGEQYQGTVTIRHPLEVFSSAEMLGSIAKLSTTDLSHLKVVCYYGCLLTRPPKLMKFDQHEYPMSMDRVLRAAGITTLDWDFKTMCCGAAFSMTESEIVHKLTGEILVEARTVGANAIAVACPLCQSNLDIRQGEIEAKRNETFGIPAFYFTQLLGLAMGLRGEDLGFNKHLLDPWPLVRGRSEEPVLATH